MGTYTTNYNLFMPTVGETGWGDLVNGNFTTIDTTMKGLNTRITTIEGKLSSLPNFSNMTIQVTPSSQYVRVSRFDHSDGMDSEVYVPICPYLFGAKYTGTIQYKAYKENSYNSSVSGECYFLVRKSDNTFTSTSILQNNTSSAVYTFTIPANTTEVILVGSGLDTGNTKYNIGVYMSIYS